MQTKDAALHMAHLQDLTGTTKEQDSEFIIKQKLVSSLQNKRKTHYIQIVKMHTVLSMFLA